MKIKVAKRNGDIETVTLRGPSLSVREGVKQDMLVDGGTDHYFNKDGTYDGWGGAFTGTMDEAHEAIEYMEIKRDVE